jgi:hypothetical protein
LLDDLRARVATADPTSGVLAIDDALFAPRGHYAPAMNARVGAALAEPVLAAAAERRGRSDHRR